MSTQTFADIIAANFQEIRRNFYTGLIDKGYEWDEDLMSDAFVCCCNTLKDKEMTKKDAIKYYWTAYINKYKTKQSHKIPMMSFEDMEEEYDEIDIPYHKDVDDIYDIIVKAVQDEYGLKKAFIWEMYVCKGVPSADLRAMGFTDINFIYFARQVKRFILKHVVPDNPKLQELLSTRKDIF